MVIPELGGVGESIPTFFRAKPYELRQANQQLAQFDDRMQSTFDEFQKVQRSHYSHFSAQHTDMASSRSLTAISRTYSSLRPPSATIAARSSPRPSLATFSASARHSASSPPAKGFRLPRPKRWDEGSESSIDKAGKYFLMTELLRGMYVVLEQFFRPP